MPLKTNVQAESTKSLRVLIVDDNCDGADALDFLGFESCSRSKCTNITRTADP